MTSKRQALRGHGQNPYPTLTNCTPTAHPQVPARATLPTTLLPLLAALALLQGACATGARAPTLSLDGASAAHTAADWDDVRAAVAVSLSAAELALLRAETPDDASILFHCRSSRDEPALLRLDRDPADPNLIHVRCAIGRFGDPERERLVIRALTDRLRALKGVEVAPLRG